MLLFELVYFQLIFIPLLIFFFLNYYNVFEFSLVTIKGDSKNPSVIERKKKIYSYINKKIQKVCNNPQASYNDFVEHYFTTFLQKRKNVDVKYMVDASNFTRIYSWLNVDSKNIVVFTAFYQAAMQFVINELVKQRLTNVIACSHQLWFQVVIISKENVCTPLVSPFLVDLYKTSGEVLVKARELSLLKIDDPSNPSKIPNDCTFKVIISEDKPGFQNVHLYKSKTKF
jgi:hypothetical protein